MTDQTTPALPPLPHMSQALFPCEDCGGSGEVGEEIYQGEFQPPERARCTTCNGSGRGFKALACTHDEVQLYGELCARAAILADHAARVEVEGLTDGEIIFDLMDEFTSEYDDMSKYDRAIAKIIQRGFLDKLNRQAGTNFKIKE